MAHLLHLRIDEAPSQGGVVHRGVAGGEGALRLGDGPGGAAHGLDTPANVHIGLAQHHGAGSLGHGVEPRTAQAVDRDARDLLWETGQEQGHSGDVAVVLSGLVRAPEVDILDLRGRHAAPLHEGLEDCRAEVVWTDGAQGAAVAADRGADRSHNPSFIGPTVAHTSPYVDPSEGVLAAFLICEARRRTSIRSSMRLLAHYHDGTVSVPYHRVRDTAHKCAPHSTKTPTPHDDQPRPDLLTQMDHLPVWTSPNQVGLSHTYPLLLDLIHLLVEEFLGLVHSLLELVLHLVGGPRQYGVGEGSLYGCGEHVSHVQLRVGAVGHISCGGEGQASFTGAVGGQEYLRREYAHRGNLLTPDLLLLRHDAICARRIDFNDKSR